MFKLCIANRNLKELTLIDSKKTSKKRNGKAPVWQALSVTTVIGVEMAITVTAGFYIGRYIDSKLETAPLFLIICLLLGLAVGIIAVVKTLQMLFEEKA